VENIFLLMFDTRQALKRSTTALLISCRSVIFSSFRNTPELLNGYVRSGRCGPVNFPKPMRCSRKDLVAFLQVFPRWQTVEGSISAYSEKTLDVLAGSRASSSGPLEDVCPFAIARFEAMLKTPRNVAAAGLDRQGFHGAGICGRGNFFANFKAQSDKFFLNNNYIERGIFTRLLPDYARLIMPRPSERFEWLSEQFETLLTIFNNTEDSAVRTNCLRRMKVLIHEMESIDEFLSKRGKEDSTKSSQSQDAPSE
jgi:hypothetical protein